jgi:signal transduction histidine kinase
LKTPLTSLVGFMQLLQRQLDRPVPDHERFRRYVAQCRQQTDRLRSLVDDLLIASRSQQGRLDLRPERFDLVALAVEIAERCAYMPERTAEHRLVLEAPAPVEGTWDRDRLDQVLTNLVSNALKYSPAGGTVLVRVERRDEEVEVTVGDEGLGISPEEQGALFQPFVRAAATNEQVGGTGLGLYIVRQIVEAHGGSAALESAVGKGTTVTVRLPLAVRGGAADGMAPAVS